MRCSCKTSPVVLSPENYNWFFEHFTFIQPVHINPAPFELHVQSASLDFRIRDWRTD